ncbi:hypothetical protein [Arenimonas composti]|uniref:VanZ-like domain-containing protein n=1 Tax=Arenimonas composti TR7-09 = DSM 18010 TaxID=1121013 RepID=A0A091BBF9_9GAMM|nr:hypothetical protein [Arenimonas composti]KFN49071.1 hypothetical protein P873_12315 [Arenimonas composti TR7-09 = DSM 18010]
MLRPFHRPRLWLGIWIGGWVLCIALSLLPAPAMPVPVGNDKVGHFLAYFVLSAWATQIFASRRARWSAAGALLALGAGMEAGQWLLTSTRMAEPADLLANCVGILLGLVPATSAWSARLLLRLDARLFAAGEWGRVARNGERAGSDT